MLAIVPDIEAFIRFARMIASVAPIMAARAVILIKPMAIAPMIALIFPEIITPIFFIVIPIIFEVSVMILAPAFSVGAGAAFLPPIFADNIRAAIAVRNDNRFIIVGKFRSHTGRGVSFPLCQRRNR